VRLLHFILVTDFGGERANLFEDFFEEVLARNLSLQLGRHVLQVLQHLGGAFHTLEGDIFLLENFLRLEESFLQPFHDLRQVLNLLRFGYPLVFWLMQLRNLHTFHFARVLLLRRQLGVVRQVLARGGVAQLALYPAHLHFWLLCGHSVVSGLRVIVRFFNHGFLDKLTPAFCG